MMWIHCLTFSLVILAAVFCSVNGQFECDDEAAVRLVDGETALEGRVEVCIGRQWGTVCDDLWDDDDATVVCRQLGFSSEDGEALGRAQLGRGQPTMQIHLDDVECNGNELQLITCPLSRRDDCNHGEDAGVRCQPSERCQPSVRCQANQPENVRSNTTATSVVISWQQPASSLLPDSYSVTLTYTNNTGTRNETLTRVVQVPGNATEVEYDQLASEQDYDYCVSAIYGPLAPTFCLSFQTTKAGSTSGGAAVGVLSAIIVLLLLLLVALGGMVLAYPRCIRSRVKDKKYLSSVSNFLDEKIYLSSNASYIQRPQLPPTRLHTATETGTVPEAPGGPISSYETIHDPPLPRHEAANTAQYEVIAENQAAVQHYETQEFKQQEYEVPRDATSRSEAAVDTYSHLNH